MLPPGTLTMLNYYKTEIFVGIISLGTIFYIWFLNVKLDRKENELQTYKISIEKENLRHYKEMKDREIQLKEYKAKFDIESAKEKTVIIERTKIQIVDIKSSDNNKTLTDLNSSCSEILKGRYNDKNIITRNI